jgi:NAD(P) transhydrogenase subunit beta
MNIYIQFAYLIASVLFIIGIKKMNKTSEARAGNQLSAVGMFIAILATVVQVEALSLIDIFVCIVIGSAIGLYVAYKVEMTQMPEMVALFNGFGGLASVAVSLSDYWLKSQEKSVDIDIITGVSIVLSIFIGGITFTGSMIAWGKLSGKVNGNAIIFGGQHPLNLLLFVAWLFARLYFVFSQQYSLYKAGENSYFAQLAATTITILLLFSLLLLYIYYV